MVRPTSLRLCALLVVYGLLTGCGGGGSSPGPVPAPATVSRTIAVGDTFNYSLSGTAQSLSTGQSWPMSGTLTESVTDSGLVARLVAGQVGMPEILQLSALHVQLVGRTVVPNPGLRGTLELNQPGATINGNLSGGTGSTASGIGILVVGNLPEGTSTILAETSSFTFQFAGRTVVTNHTALDYQDPATTNLVQVGDTGGTNVAPRLANAPVEAQPGAWGPSSSFNNQLSYPDSTIETQTFTVQGADNVTVPAGTFACWRCLVSTQIGSGTQGNITKWYAPQVGLIKEAGNVTVTASDGSQYTVRLTASLTSTTVTH